MSPLITTDRIRAHFAIYGAVGSVRLGYDPTTGMSLGIARVEFVVSSDTSHPRIAANDAINMGRTIQAGDPPANVALDVDDYFTKQQQLQLRHSEHKVQRSPIRNIATSRGPSLARSPRRSLSSRNQSPLSVAQEHESEAKRTIVRSEISAIRIARSCISFSQNTESDVMRHFERFRPASVVRDGAYWYVLFTSDRDAHRCQRLCDKQQFAGHIIDVEIFDPVDNRRLAELDEIAKKRALLPMSVLEYGHNCDRSRSRSRSRSRISGDKAYYSSTRKSRGLEVQQFSENDPELLKYTQELLLREISETFLQYIQKRRIQPLVSDFAQKTNGISATGSQSRLSDAKGSMGSQIIDPTLMLKRMSRGNALSSDRPKPINAVLADLPSFRRGAAGTSSSAAGGLKIGRAAKEDGTRSRKQSVDCNSTSSILSDIDIDIDIDDFDAQSRANGEARAVKALSKRKRITSTSTHRLSSSMHGLDSSDIEPHDGKSRSKAALKNRGNSARLAAEEFASSSQDMVYEEDASDTSDDEEDVLGNDYDSDFSDLAIVPQRKAKAKRQDAKTAKKPARKKRARMGSQALSAVESSQPGTPLALSLEGAELVEEEPEPDVPVHSTGSARTE
ncbi:histone methyltransferase set1, partial [Coemansia erecta]